jgi:hypothetical protein
VNDLHLIFARFVLDAVVRSNARARTPSATGSAQSAEKNEIERFSALHELFYMSNRLLPQSRCSQKVSTLRSI